MQLIGIVNLRKEDKEWVYVHISEEELACKTGGRLGGFGFPLVDYVLDAPVEKAAG